MKKAVATTGITGGLLGSAQTVAAAEPTLEINGRNSGYYTIRVNTEDVAPKEGVSNSNISHPAPGISWLEGSTSDGSYHNYVVNGNIYAAHLRGSMLIQRFDMGSYGLNRYGDITVSGQDGNYTIGTTSKISEKSDLESTDYIQATNQCTGDMNGDDTDVWDGEGSIKIINATTNDTQMLIEQANIK
ncbi:hypothetical protein [Haladaptatus paucihalophilus]|nr:hypothetical protein [Haladaptatus paucihalophilus]